MHKRASALLGGLALLAGAATVADAQYYYQPAPRYHPGPQFYPQPYPGPQYYEPAPRRPVPRHYSPYAHQGFGTVCVTSRGECGVGQVVPIGTGCKCRIPNFGMKRGHVQY
jgi:hypothetical protein